MRRRFLNLGLFYNNPCTNNCKAIGKYLNKKIFDNSCANYYYLTEEENYCTDDCKYYNMNREKGTNKCVESCKSVGQILISNSYCTKSTSTKKFTYKNEDYAYNDCKLFGLFINK